MISLVVLAAGKSTRMKGRNKLLIKIEGKPIIRRVVEACLKSKADEVIVVVGWEADKVQAALSDLPCRLVLNNDYEEGQSSSLKAGLREVSSATEALLVLPADVAKITPEPINLTIREYVRRKAPIVIAAHKRRPGHPILLDRRLFKEIGGIDEQTFGLKSVVKQHEGEVVMVETGSADVLLDVDTPEDLGRM